jgi:hypothetical protein
MNLYANELGDAGSDVMDVLQTVQNTVKKVTDIATDPFGASQSQPGAGNQGSDSSSYSANLPDSYKETAIEIGKNTGIIPKDQQTTETPAPTPTTSTDSSDLDVGGFLKRNLTPRPLPAVVGVGVGGYTYYKSKKVLRSIGFGVGAMFIGNFIQSRVEMSKAGGN